MKAEIQEKRGKLAMRERTIIFYHKHSGRKSEKPVRKSVRGRVTHRKK